MPEKLITVKKKKHARKHGFLSRAKTLGGQKVIKRRQLKGRKRV